MLTIARGMIEDAPFLILDEATSSVDTRTEEYIQKAMDELMKNRKSFIYYIFNDIYFSSK